MDVRIAKLYKLINTLTDIRKKVMLLYLQGFSYRDISEQLDIKLGMTKKHIFESKKTLKLNDKCVARVIAISYKDPMNPKIGLTMRQPRLGTQKWIEEEIKREKKVVVKKVAKK